MSTTATHQTLDISNTPRITFATLVRVELRKSYDTRAGFWLLLVTVLFSAAAMVGVLLYAVLGDHQVSLGTYLTSTNFTSAQLLPVLGILLVTSEWGQRTAMVTFTLESSRGKVVGAKLVAGIVLALLVAFAASLVAVVVNALSGLLSGDVSWSTDGFPFGWFLFGQALAMVAGFSLAALFLNTAAAIVVYFLYSWVFPIAFAIIGANVQWFDDLRNWIDFNAAQQPLYAGDDVTGKVVAHFIVSGMLWVGLPLALGLWRILRAEVK